VQLKAAEVDVEVADDDPDDLRAVRARRLLEEDVRRDGDAGDAEVDAAARAQEAALEVELQRRLAVAVGIGAGVAAALAAIARPLLYATVAPQAAAARGVRVGVLGAAFFVLLGADAGEAAQAVGALLLLGLIAAPAGAALRLTANPLAGLGLSVAFAVGAVWIGVTAAYYVPSLPPSTAIVGAAAAGYALTWLPAVRARAV